MVGLTLTLKEVDLVLSNFIIFHLSSFHTEVYLLSPFCFFFFFLQSSMQCLVLFCSIFFCICSVLFLFFSQYLLSFNICSLSVCFTVEYLSELDSSSTYSIDPVFKQSLFCCLFFFFFICLLLISETFIYYLEIYIFQYYSHSYL